MDIAPKRRYLIAIVGSLLFCHLGESRLGIKCSDLLSRVLHGEKVVWVDDQVEIIYLPDSLSTMLRVGEGVYGIHPETGDLRVRSDEAFRNLGRQSEEHTQVRFGVRVSEAELKKLNKYLENEESPVVQISCTQVVCSILQHTTGVWVPAPFNFTPTVNAAFLAANRYFPGGRVQSIEVISKGGKAFETLSSTINKLKPGLKVEGVMVLVVSAGAAGIVRLVIPLFAGGTDEQQVSEEENR